MTNQHVSQLIAKTLKKKRWYSPLIRNKKLNFMLPNQITQMLEGKRHLCLREAIQISKALNIPVDELGAAFLKSDNE